MRILIFGTYVLPISRPPIEHGGVLIEDGLIQKVGPRQELEPEDADLVIDGNLIVMPGLINTHTHAAMVGFRGLADDLPLMEWLENHIWPMEKAMVTPQFVRYGLKLAMMEMIRGGVTTFADMYFFQKDAAQIVDQVGMRAVLAEGVIDFPTPSNPDPESQLAYIESFIQEWLNHPLITPAVGPHAPYSTSPDVYRRAHHLSERYGVPLLTHVAETRAEIQQIQERYSKTPIEHLEAIGVLDERTVAAHMVWVQPSDMEIVERHRVGIAHCPESNLKLGSGIAPIPAYLERGLKVGLATDGATSNNDLDMFGEMRTAALLHKGHTQDPTVAPADQILWMATLGGAQVLGLADRVGSMDVGKEADVITLDLDTPHLTPIYNPVSHVVYAAKASDVRDVFVRGNPLMLDGEFQTLDPEEVLETFRREVEAPIRAKLPKSTS